MKPNIYTLHVFCFVCSVYLEFKLEIPNYILCKINIVVVKVSLKANIHVVYN